MLSLIILSAIPSVMHFMALSNQTKSIILIPPRCVSVLFRRDDRGPLLRTRRRILL